MKWRPKEEGIQHRIISFSGNRLYHGHDISMCVQISDNEDPIDIALKG